jgi:glutathione peroxidase
MNLLLSSLAGLALLLPLPRSLAAEAACPAILQHTFPRLQDEKPQSLCQYTGRVLLVVNTASFCGFAPQFAALQKLHETYAPRGLLVLGVPSNDFNQEATDNAAVKAFCDAEFGVDFPMAAIGHVKGPEAYPFFAWAGAPGWNFFKYLVGRDGALRQSFPSKVEPDSPALLRAVEAALA